MIYAKIVHGYVKQSFNDLGQLVSQEFVAGDDVEYEQDGSPINVAQMPLQGNEYSPFWMVKMDPKDLEITIANEVLFTINQRFKLL